MAESMPPAAIDDSPSQMRSATEIADQIAKLERRSQELHALLLQHCRDVVHPQLVDDRPSFWQITETIARWRREAERIDDQLRVLKWVSGKYEVFPWH